MFTSNGDVILQIVSALRSFTEEKYTSAREQWVH